MAGPKREFIAGPTRLGSTKDWIPGMPGDSICPDCGSPEVVTLQFPNERQAKEQLVCRQCPAKGPKVDINSVRVWQYGIR